MAKQVRNFLAVIAGNGRLHELSDILSAYAELANDQAQVTNAEITSARPLDAGNRQLLEQQVASLAGGGQVQATYREDASLLGGRLCGSAPPSTMARFVRNWMH